MSGDEALYRQYLSGDDTGLEALMKQYGDPLTMYIDGYLHDVHEAEELMLDVFAYLFKIEGLAVVRVHFVHADVQDAAALLRPDDLLRQKPAVRLLMSMRRRS